MYVGRKMTRPVITIHRDAPLMDARNMLNKNLIKQLPVVDGKARMVGILTDRDLREAWASSATTLSVYELNYLLQKIKVKAVMKKEVITVTPDTTIERAAHIMHENRITGLPVLSKSGRLVGIITYADMVDVLLGALGMGTDSLRIIVLAANRIGVLAEVTGILRDLGVNIFSLITLPLDQYPGVDELVLRIDPDNAQQGIDALKEAGYSVISEYIEDLGPHIVHKTGTEGSACRI